MYSPERYPDITLDGLPHSEIPGSTVVCTSPRLIAAYHVLHRLLVPRHPPYALSSLTVNLTYPGQTTYAQVLDANSFVKEQSFRIKKS